MESAIEATGIRKTYRSKGGAVSALNGISIAVRKGIIFSFLGRNGAGKTTFIKIASTLLMPTEGKIEVLGRDAIHDPYSAREFIAVVPQGIKPFFHLTPREHIYNYLRIRKVSKEEARNRTEWMIERTGIEGFADRKCLTLSGGQKQITMVAMILATFSPILFLDEPTIGMDPMARRQIWNLIQEIRDKGSTIFLTTHYLDEAERLSDELAVIDGGRVLYSGNISGMKATVGADYRAILPRNAPPGLLRLGERVIDDGNRFLVLTNRDSAVGITDAASRLGIEVSVGPITLEEAFIAIAGRGVEDDA